MHHLIAVLQRRKFYDVQWGIVTDGFAEIVWGTSTDLSDIGQSTLSGTPSNIRRPAPGQSWTVAAGIEESEAKLIAAAVREDVGMVADRLDSFPSRRTVRDYLLANRDPIDQRDFVIPANLPLKLFFAAALAVLDADAEACTLLEDVEAAMAKYADDEARRRLARLRTACARICPPH